MCEDLIGGADVDGGYRNQKGFLVPYMWSASRSSFAWVRGGWWWNGSGVMVVEGGQLVVVSSCPRCIVAVVGVTSSSRVVDDGHCGDSYANDGHCGV